MSSVIEFKKNPEEELRKLYGLSREKCISILVHKFPNTAPVAKEIFQEAVVILWENIQKEKFTEGELEPYLIGIIKNLGFTRNRQFQKDRNFINLDSVERIMLSDENPLTPYNEERVALIKMCIEQMEGPCKKLLDLFFNQEKEREEIIKIMEYKNSDTLKTKKYKCIKRLQKLIKEHIKL